MSCNASAPADCASPSAESTPTTIAPLTPTARSGSFFGRQPCTALYRALFEVRDGRVTVVVAVAWVDMPDADQARRLQQLVDRNGTGNLTELTKEGRRPRSVEWTGQHYTSARDDVTFVNAQAEPVGSTARAVGLARTVSALAVS